VTPILPVLSGTDVVAALAEAGFQRGPRRGSHVGMHKEGRTAVVPLQRQLAQGTLRSILRQAGLSLEDFTLL
jgi:predicted RNA binding protein YcfA (HicA-like mRNA interferase family)